MKIDPTALRTIDGRVGVMLKMITCAERSDKPAGCTERPHELKWPAEVLGAKLVIAQEGPTATHVNRDEPILPSESKIERYKVKTALVSPAPRSTPAEVSSRVLKTQPDAISHSQGSRAARAISACVK
jgi:hypothetical protein